MFDNIDDKLKAWAKATFWILTLGFIALAIITGWQEEAYVSYYGSIGHDTVFHPEFFFGFLIGGPIDAYIVSALIYGVGEIISNQYEIMSKIQNNEQNSSLVSVPASPEIGFHKSGEITNEQKTAPVQANNISQSQKSTPPSELKITKKKTPVKVTVEEDGTLCCPICGLKQAGTRQVCFECGQVFINGQDVPYWCGKCGKAGPFDDICPDCGSSEKIINE